jgi:hypothetical protein
MRIPSTEEDRRLFEKSTTITIGNGETTGFWGSSWLLGDSPKGLAPSIYAISRRRSRSVANALLTMLGSATLMFYGFDWQHNYASLPPSGSTYEVYN